MLNYTFVQNIKVLAFPGAVGCFGEMVGTAGYKKAMFIHGGSLRRSGVADKVAASLAEYGVECVSFEKVKSDPPAELIDEGAAFAKENGCDCVIAIGGGSAIDMAKAINMLRFNEGSVMEYFAKPHVASPGLFVAPTTAGTGAELSTGSVITDTVHNMKLPLPVNNSMPEAVVLDPELTVSMPAAMTMQTGLDAFSHAVEGYCNLMSNIMMDQICEKIMEIVAENLPVVVKDGSDIAARAKMQAAACMGGWSLTNVYANVGHSLAHVVGANYHLVHGSACSYGLPPVLKHIAPAVPQKVRRIGEILGASFTGSETPEEIGVKAADAYISFRDGLGMPSVKEANIVVEDLDTLATLVVNEPFAQLTPMPVDKDAAAKMLREMLAL
ncbi:MAG: iron-containing alcohol dehydrogenase [Oscillospiraceae bacterium]|nr:iron-containing alcohol dehydrogenase [Oscillospiraceae bacterium]